MCSIKHLKDNLEKQQSTSPYDIKIITLENYNQMIEILQSKIKNGLRSGINKNQYIKNKNQYIKNKNRYIKNKNQCIQESFADQKLILSMKKRASQSKIKVSSEFVEFLATLVDEPNANFPATQIMELINEVDMMKAEKNLSITADIVHNIHLRKNLEEILLTNIKKIMNGMQTYIEIDSINFVLSFLKVGSLIMEHQK